MRSLTLAPAVLVAGLALAAPAGATVLSTDAAGVPSVAPAPSGGGALVAYPTGVRAGVGAALAVRDRRADGTWSAPDTATVGALTGAAPVLRPSGAALMLVPWGPAGASPDRLLALRRAAPGAAWTTETVMPSAAKAYVSLIAWAANRSGDLVALVRGPGGVTLVRAPSTGPIATTLLSKGYDGGVTVGPGGQVRAAVAYGNRLRVWDTTMTGPAGSPQVVAQVRNAPDVALAVDARGTTTIAFSMFRRPNNIAIVAMRATAGMPFGARTVLDPGPNSQFPQVVATGTRTAIAWIHETSPDGVRVALAGARGGFGAALRPATPVVRLPGEAGRFASGAGFPQLAAGPDGTVALAYGYGTLQAAQGALLRPGATRFSRPFLAAPAIDGGTVGPTVLADGTPLILTSGGAGIVASSRRSGPPLDLKPPALTTSALTAAQLQSGAITTKVRCPRGCALTASARLTAGGGRDLVISRQYRGAALLPAGATRDVTFNLTPAGRAKFAATGRAHIVVLVTAVSPTGVSRTSRQQLVVGAR